MPDVTLQFGLVLTKPVLNKRLPTAINIALGRLASNLDALNHPVMNGAIIGIDSINCYIIQIQNDTATCANWLTQPMPIG